MITAGDAPDTVLLHGLGGRPEVWHQVMALLPDLPARAVALPWTARGELSWAREDLVAHLVSAVGATAGGVLVAHSLASLVTLTAVSTGRLAPRAIVLVNPFYKRSPDDFDWLGAEYLLTNFHRVFEQAVDLESGRFPEPKRRWLARQLRDAVGPYGWTAWFRHYLETPFLDLRGIDVPVLVAAGDADIAAPVADGVALARALPRARLAVHRTGGHFPMLQDPEWLAGTIDDFVRDALMTSEAGALRA